MILGNLEKVWFEFHFKVMMGVMSSRVRSIITEV